MSTSPLARLGVHYNPSDTLADDTLALLAFGAHRAESDPRCLNVPLEPIGADPLLRECWQVDAMVTHGSQGALRWSAGGGWLFVALELNEAELGGIEPTAEQIYRQLCGFVAAREECHLLRIWNYLHAINEGEGDSERYRQFCNGRARGLSAQGIRHYPAATAIGHHRAGVLQIYALCATQPGQALENPRQVSAWRYPREYGPTPPSFARAMKLPGGGLAISGTAAVVGHASCHDRDLQAQVAETCVNLRALLDSAAMADFDATSPLKIYLRHPRDAQAVQAALAQHLDVSVPSLLLHGDICRRELLVEIDGWRFSG